MQHIKFRFALRKPFFQRRYGRLRASKRHLVLGAGILGGIWGTNAKTVLANGKPVIVVVPEYWDKSEKLNIKQMKGAADDLVGIGLMQDFVQQLSNTGEFRILDARLVPLSENEEEAAPTSLSQIGNGAPIPPLEAFLIEGVDAVVKINFGNDKNPIVPIMGLGGMMSNGTSRTNFFVTNKLTARIVTHSGAEDVKIQPPHKYQWDYQSDIPQSFGVTEALYEPRGASMALRNAIAKRLLPNLKPRLLASRTRGVVKAPAVVSRPVSKPVNGPVASDDLGQPVQAVPRVVAAASGTGDELGQPIVKGAKVGLPTVAVRDFGFDPWLLKRFPTVELLKVKQFQNNSLRQIVDGDPNVSLVEGHEAVLRRLETMWALRQMGRGDDSSERMPIDYQIYGEIAGFSVQTNEDGNAMRLEICIHLRALPIKDLSGEPIVVTENVVFDASNKKDQLFSLRDSRKGDRESVLKIYAANFDSAVQKAMKTAWQKLQPQLKTDGRPPASGSFAATSTQPDSPLPHRG